MDVFVKYEKIFVSEDTTIHEALKLLNITGKRVLFVTDNRLLKAALNDGDIRRCLLKCNDIELPISEAANYKPKYLFNSERGNAKSFIAENQINAVPIVDDDMQIIDVVFAHDNIELSRVKIRELGTEDLKIVLDFFDQMAGDTRAMFNRGDANRIRAIEHLSRKKFDNQIHFGATVIDDNGVEEMVGYVFLWDLDTRIPWLGIAVHENWKGNHLGRLLMEHLDRYADSNGYGGLMLTTVPANVRAHSLYSRMGFEFYGTHFSGEFMYIKRFIKKN